MKKIIVALIVLMGVVFLYGEEQPCDPKTFSITIGAGVRSFSEELFKDVYDGTPMVYSFDAAVRVLRPLEIFAHTDILSIDGKTTFTQEDTKLKITPFELGFRFLVMPKKSCKQKIFPYIGAGLGYYMIKEEFAAGSPMEPVDEKRLGFFGEGGVRLYAMTSIFVDLKFKYITLKSENGTQLGGLAYMGGIGFSF